jgi:hypothetical protein
MRRIISIVLVLVLIAPAALAQNTQPVTKRAVVPIGIPSPIQAKALAHRVSSTNAITKEFFVAYGGQAFVTFKVRSDGAHEVNWNAYFGDANPCSGSTSGATYSGFGCLSDIEAGGKIRVILSPNGQEAAICCARLQFKLVNVNAAAVATQD